MSNIPLEITVHPTGVLLWHRKGTAFLHRSEGPAAYYANTGRVGYYRLNRKIPFTDFLRERQKLL